MRDSLIAPERCPVELTGNVPETPRVPDEAGFPAPVSEEERAAVGSYLGWLGDLSDHDRDVTRRLKAGKAWCDERAKG